MAVITKKVVAPVQKVAPKVATVASKVAPKVAPKKEGFEVFSMDNISLIPKGGGGGRALSPLATTCLSMEVGQGIKISDEKYNGGKGVASLYAAAKRRGIRLRVRRDVNGQLWLFRIEAQEEQVAE